MIASSERELAGLAEALGAAQVAGLAPAEERLLAEAARPRRGLIEAARAAIAGGGDPLGEAFCALRTPALRREHGATYTPAAIVDAMVAWAGRAVRPARVVDPGMGSARFLVAAARRFPEAELVGVEIDPLAALLGRAALAAAGLRRRARVLLEDYRALRLDPAAGPTLFLGNPPYVRHHDIAPRWKRWLAETARRRGLPVSQLAGLHVHFFLATAEHAAPDDVGVLITAAEWLDVNYGALPRALFAGDLGGLGLHLLEPTAEPFPDAATTAVISCFRVGARARTVAMRRVASLPALGSLERGRQVPVADLRAAPRWTPLTRPAVRAHPGLIELGELCAVRRGQVTGANAFWIAGAHAPGLPAHVLKPTVTHARELLAAGAALVDAAPLRRVIDLPEDLSTLDPEARRAADALLRKGRAAGVDRGYIASHRRAWWAVALYPPAPILATYMARRPPGFVRNLAGARHINIAHGLYPRVPLAPAQLDALAAHLARTASCSAGRTYAGGLTKFERREMERLLVPRPELLLAGAA
jgi:adenine-specific DNA-methyltransferase